MIRYLFFHQSYHKIGLVFMNSNDWQEQNEWKRSRPFSSLFVAIHFFNEETNQIACYNYSSTLILKINLFSINFLTIFGLHPEYLQQICM